MKDNFWRHCLDAVCTYRSGNAEEASRLLEAAKATLKSGELDSVLLKRREQHIVQLETHFLTRVSLTPEISNKGNVSMESADVVAKCKLRIDALEMDKQLLSERLRTMPSIDPIFGVNQDPGGFSEPVCDDFGIIVFGHTRIEEIQSVLESLKRQDALRFTEVWLDGHQGSSAVKAKLQSTVALVKKYDVKHLHTQNGNFGFRKMMLLGLSEMSCRYRDILVLEDDCFPTRRAVEIFRRDLDTVRDNPHIFSVYGHHFLVSAEQETCARFQGWGWATTSEKLRPILRQLMDCYSMTEDRYLEFVRLVLTPEVRRRIDVTPPRQPTHTIEKFFAWDETLCLLASLNKLVHKPTSERTIYNCGMGKDSTHFGINKRFREPPFNLITPDEVWQYF